MSNRYEILSFFPSKTKRKVRRVLSRMKLKRDQEVLKSTAADKDFGFEA